MSCLFGVLVCIKKIGQNGYKVEPKLFVTGQNYRMFGFINVFGNPSVKKDNSKFYEEQKTNAT